MLTSVFTSVFVSQSRKVQFVNACRDWAPSRTVMLCTRRTQKEHGALRRPQMAPQMEHV